MRKNGLWGALIVYTLIAAPMALLAQGGTASITGRVTDPKGLPLNDAKVQIVSAQTGAVYNTSTNNDGLYNLTSLPLGTYRLTLDKEGFEEVVRPDITLHVADIIAINIQMVIGSVTQSVTVTGGAPLVNTTTSSLGGLVDDKQVSNLPLNGRDYILLTLLQPGVVQNTNINTTGSSSGQWFSSNGAPLRSNNYTLDGAILQNINAGSAASLSGVALGLDGIEEYRVITTVPAAEYGIGMGSQTVIVSRSGTNELHGAVFEYLRNNAMDAANFFDRPTALDGRRSPPLRRNNFGAAFGGPIAHSTFFFMTYEGLRERYGVTTVTNVIAAGCHGNAGDTIMPGTATGECPQITSPTQISSTTAPLLALYPLPNLPTNTGLYQYTFPYSQPTNDDYGQARIDHNFSQSDSLFVRYTGEYDVQTPVTAYPQFTNPRLSGADYATIAETHIFHSAMVNNFRFSYSHTASTRNSPNDLAGPQTSIYTGLPVPNITIGGVTTFGPQQSRAIPSLQNQDIYTLEDDYYLTKGKHSIKFGTMINRIRWFMQNPNRLGGTITFAGVTNFLNDSPTNFAITTPGSSLQRTYQFWTLGFYLQDDWRVLPNFVVNAGLRYEPTTQIQEVHGYGSSFIHPASDATYTVGPPFLNPSKMNFSPRLGFVWDVHGNGRTAVSGGGAIMYDVANLGNTMINMSPVQPPFSSGTTYTTTGPTGSCPFTIPFVASPGCTSVIGKSSDVTDQYHMNQSMMYSWSLAVQQQLPFRSSISLGYVGSRGEHLMTEDEGNPNLPNGFANSQVTFPITGAVRPNGTGVGSTGNGWGNIGVWASTADSIYHSMQVAFLKQVTHGLQAQSSFTWSKLIDNGEGLGQGDTTEVSIFNADPYNPRYDRGPAYFDITGNWVVNALYTFPEFHAHSSFVHGLMNGWAISGINTMHTGIPFHPLLTSSRSNSGVFTGTNVDRPNWATGFTGAVVTHNWQQWFNPAAFTLQPAGTLGNVGRDSLRGPGYVNTDFSVKKDTKLRWLGSAGLLDMRADIFNIFNHPNFAMPSPAIFSGGLTAATQAPLTTAGVISATVGNGAAPIGAQRVIQISARIAF